MARDNESHANTIAKTFHDAGVLTLGLLDDADFDCFDSVVLEPIYTEYPKFIKAILQPIATQGMIDYGFNDLKTNLADTRYFFIKSVTSYGNGRVAEAVDFIKSALTSSNLIKTIEWISIFLYFNRDGQQPLAKQEITALSNFVSDLPKNINVIWAAYPDDSIKKEAIKFSIISAGKDLGNG